MKINDLDILRITHTHSDCLDVLSLYEDEMIKYFPFDWKHAYLTNKKFSTIMNSHFFVYDETDSYPLRWLKILEELKCEYIFLDHEDMFLYEECDYKTLTNVIDAFLTDAGEYLRLVKSDQSNYRAHEKCADLYRLKSSSKWIFSIQPSIWKRETLIKVLRCNPDVDVWKLEVRSQKVMKKLRVQSYFAHRNGVKRGIHHYDSEIYPYIATAIGKGKWNLTEYGERLFPLFLAKGIDPSSRGWF